MILYRKEINFVNWEDFLQCKYSDLNKGGGTTGFVINSPSESNNKIRSGVKAAALFVFTLVFSM